MRFLKYALIILSIAIAAGQQSAKTDTASPRDINPKLVPAVAENILTTTVAIKQISLYNDAATTVTCIILDRASSPLPIVGGSTTALSIATGTAYVITWPAGRRATNGVTWSCSSGTAVTGHIVYEPYVP